jgi:hypothetical protein
LVLRCSTEELPDEDTIVDQKPTVTTTIVDHGIFSTRAEAETGMKTMKMHDGRTRGLMPLRPFRPAGSLRRGFLRSFPKALRICRVSAQRRGGTIGTAAAFAPDLLNGRTLLWKLALCALACLATPSFAQTAAAAHYYVVLDSATNKCAIVDHRPKSKARTIDDEIYFKTRSEAKTGMQAMKACGTVQADRRR